ncbi:MAG: nitronate monooxygenase family protein [Holosporales bacterium]|jgi:enoyl-[acyl-carrier protein] reductase II|nr:nitronate monooxygenase family protein [Holosporales bacterium]
MSKLADLFKKGTDFLGTKYAVLGGAMTWISDSDLVSAISNSGCFGVLACGAMLPKSLENEIRLTKEKTNKPFGVNLMTMHPQLQDLINIVAGCNVKHLVLAGGLPNKEIIEKVKLLGLKLVCFTPAVSIGQKLLKMGADALIIEGHEAGGHVGPTALTVLAQEVLPAFKEDIVFVAGGIATGSMMANFLKMGASGCQIGTLFACVKESNAHLNFKRTFFRANSRDAVLSVQLDKRFPAIPVRAIKNKASQDFMALQKQVLTEFETGSLDLKAGQLKIERFWAGALKQAVIYGDVERGSVMAGQSVGLVKEELSVNEVVNNIITEAEQYLSL